MAAELPGRLAELGGMDNPTDLAAAFDDAMMGADLRTIRGVGRLVLGKLTQQKDATPVGTNGQRLAALDILRQVSTRFGAWKTEHPSALEQKRATEAALAARLGKLEASHRWMLKYAGLR